MTRSLAAALLLWSFMSPTNARLISPPDAIADIIIRADWQYPQQLPPRFRNHCQYEYFTARPYCSDHCGSDYQFYYCSEASFGCCHLGRGYCDWRGLLRCHP
jgi:hypothetical protein